MVDPLLYGGWFSLEGHYILISWYIALTIWISSTNNIVNNAQAHFYIGATIRKPLSSSYLDSMLSIIYIIHWVFISEVLQVTISSFLLISFLQLWFHEAWNIKAQNKEDFGQLFSINLVVTNNTHLSLIHIFSMYKVVKQNAIMVTGYLYWADVSGSYR